MNAWRIRATTATLTASLLACAPLIDFDSLTDHHADASDADAAGDGAASADGSSGDATARDAGTSDTGVSDASACQDQNNGFYCANDGLDAYAGDPTDLVWCFGNAIQTIEKCNNGCIASPFLYPDTCDKCTTKGNGAWCGKEFSTYRSELKEVVFFCDGGKNGAPPQACGVASPTCHPKDGGASCGP